MPGVHHIELNLQDVEQLFNTMDPSLFHEKDLDDDASEFILSWAQEFHRPERPLEIYLYEWWPLRRRGQILDKLSWMAGRLGPAYLSFPPPTDASCRALRVRGCGNAKRIRDTSWPGR